MYCACASYSTFPHLSSLSLGLYQYEIQLQVVDTSKRIDEVPKWFTGARLNYAENCLLNGKEDNVALYFAREYQLPIHCLSSNSSVYLFISYQNSYVTM